MAGSRAPDTPAVKARGDVFSSKVSTRVCQEIADPDNPFLAERILWHGYDVLDLMERRSLVEVVFCLLKGELPSPGQAQQLQQILILLANPGPRHAGVRAVMNASVSKTDPLHFLPVGLALMGGEQLGAAEVLAAMKFLRRNLRHDPRARATELREALSLEPWQEGDNVTPAPGFGSCFGGVDSFARAAAARLHQSFPQNEALAWGIAFVAGLESANAGWRMTGLAAAMFADLGFTPNVGACLFQLASSPGLLAHGIELAGKPLTDMPFVSDSHYHHEQAESDD
jgi:citrate synthase